MDRRTPEQVAMTNTEEQPIRPAVIRNWLPVVVVATGFVAQYVGLRGDSDALKREVAALSVRVEKLTDAVHMQSNEIAVLRDRAERSPK